VGDGVVKRLPNQRRGAEKRQEEEGEEDDECEETRAVLRTDSDESIWSTSGSGLGNRLRDTRSCDEQLRMEALIAIVTARGE